MPISGDIVGIQEAKGSLSSRHFSGQMTVSPSHVPCITQTEMPILELSHCHMVVVFKILLLPNNGK